MKKLLLGTLVLLAFNAAVIMTQMSCNKDAKADTPAPGTTALKQLDLVIYTKSFHGSTKKNEIWMSKLDGTDNHEIKVTLPDNIRVSDEASLTPDGKKIVFSAVQNTVAAPNNWGDGGIYTCDTDGKNAKRIIDPNPDGYVMLQGAY